MNGTLRAETTAIQWGVGQGGFHTQRTEFRRHGEDDVVLRFVYDCGSISAPINLRPWVTDYVDSLRAERASHIDLLVISHFDYDHVSGLSELAAQLKEIRVHRVIAPAITRLDALVLCANSFRFGSQRYRRLLMDPAANLRELFPGAEVQLIEGSQPNPNLEQSEQDTPERVIVGPGIPRIGDTPGGGTQVTAGADVKVWELIPHAVPSVETGRPALVQALKNQLSIDVDALSDNELFENICTQVHTLREVRHLTSAHFGVGGVNATSVSLWAGPAVDTKHRACGVVEFPSSSPIYAKTFTAHSSDRSVAWLGTGDAELKSRTSVSDLAKHFTVQRLESAFVVGAPHHGSHHNSSSDLWAEFTDHTVITLHAQNRYGHPASATVAAIRAAQLTPALVNQVTGPLMLRSWHEF